MAATSCQSLWNPRIDEAQQMHCYCLLGWKCVQAPLCCAEPMDFTSTILLPGTHWKKGKATSSFLWTSSETQTSSDPDPSRGRKSLGPQQKRCSLLCKQLFKQKDLQSKTLVEGTKKKMKIILALGNLCDVQNHGIAFQSTRSISPEHLPGSQKLPGHITAAPRCFSCSEKLNTELQGLSPRKNLSNVSPSPGTLEFHCFLCVCCDRVINACFSYLYNVRSGLA